MNLLSILQFLYEFHFQHFHLHHFSFFLSNCFFLFCYLSSNIFSCSFLFSSFELINFSPLDLFLSSLFFHPYVIFLFNPHLLLHSSLLILLTDKFRLLSFFLFMENNCILNLCFFCISFSPLHSNFLFNGILFLSSYFFLMCLLHCNLSVLLFKSRNFSCSSSSFFNFFPSFHFFLFKKSNTIGKQLSITITAIKIEMLMS